MSLDIRLYYDIEHYGDLDDVEYNEEVDLDLPIYEVWHGNITHNLNDMAGALGCYQHLWRPEELGIVFARHLIKPLRDACDLLLKSEKAYRKYEPENGWGTIGTLRKFLVNYSHACQLYPNSKIDVCR